MTLLGGRIAYFQLLEAGCGPNPVGVRVRDDAHRSAVAAPAAEVEQGALDGAAPDGVVVQVERSLLVEEKDPDSARRQGVLAAAVVAPGCKRMP